MEITPEIKAQLEEQKKQCVFCKIMAGEIPSKKVYEDDKTFATLDIYPVIPGQTLFLLKEHYPIMPYIQADEFKHFFGITSQMAGVIKDAMVRTGVNVFIANGYVAGQTAPHFMIQFLPREKGDGFFNFMFKMNVETPSKSSSMVANNLPIMMRNHFGRNPAPWHKGKGEMPAHLKPVIENATIVYEDELSLAIIPNKGAVEGHIIIYSKEEEKDIGKLSIESSSHLFYVASFAATAVFEGLGAQGTNIIAKSGVSDDNDSGRLELHVLLRKENDSLKSINWQPNQGQHELDSVQSKIKDKTWKVSYKKSGEKKKETKPVGAPKIMTISDRPIETNEPTEHKKVKKMSPEEEIEKAIGRFHK